MLPPRRPRTSRRWICCTLTLSLTRARAPNQVEMQGANPDPDLTMSLTPNQVEMQGATPDPDPSPDPNP